MSIRSSVAKGTAATSNDTFAARIVSAEITNGTYSAGSNVFVTLSFNEAINTSGLTTSNTSVTLNVGGNLRTASYDASRSSQAGVSNAAANLLVFKYTVQAGESDTDGIALVANSLAIGGTVLDRAPVPNLSSASNFTFAGGSNPLAVIPATTVVPVPGAPTITGLSDDTGVAGDGITADTTLTLSGTAAAGATVTVSAGSTQVGTTTAGASGAWSVTTAALASGSYAFTAVATTAGGTSVASAARSATVDALAPTATVTGGAGAAAVATTTYTVTFSETVTGVGAADFQVNGTGVTGAVTGVTAGTGNSYTVTVGNIAGSGQMSLGIVNSGITDVAGNAVGAVTNTAGSRTVDRVAPAAFTVVPVGNGNYNATSSSGATFSLTGAEAGTTFTWVVKNGATATAVGNATAAALPMGGVAMTGLGTLADGSYTLEVTLADTAGNTTVRSAALSLDNTAPGFAGTTPVQIVERTGDAAGDPYKAGDTIVVRLNFDSAVTVSGTAPTLDLTVGSTTRTAAYDASRSTTTSLAFTYTVVAGDTDTDGITVTNSIGNRASITDVAGNALPGTATFAALTNQAGHKVDTNAPVVTVDAVSGGFVNKAEADAGVTIGGTVTTDAGDGTKVFVTAGTAAPVEATLTGGNWSTTLTTAQIAALGDGTGRTFTVVATDAAGNSSGNTDSPTFVIDRVVPVPTIALAAGADTGLSATDFITRNLTPDLTVTLGASVAVGDTLQLYVNGDPTGASRMVNAAEKLAGSLTVTTPNLGADGPKSLTVQMSDAAGNVGAQPTAITLELDRTAPNAPTSALDLSEGSDTGVLSTDNITSATTPTIRAFLTGTGAAVGDRVEIREGTSTVGSLVLSTSAQITAGFVDVTLSTALAEGARALTMRLVDRAGNEGTDGVDLTVTVDTTKLGTPTAAPSLATDSGSSPTDRITNAPTPTVSVSLAGTGADVGDRIQVLVGGAVVGTPVTLTAGDITAGTIDVVLSAPGADGTKVVTARAIDAAGNIGDAGPSLTFTLDRVAPAATAITVDLLAADDTFAGSGTNADNRTNDATPRFEVAFGTDVNAGDSVQLLDGGVPTGTAAVLTAADVAARKVTVTAGALGTDGVKAITARITDVAGNASSASAALDVTLDTTVPGTPATPDLVAGSDSGASTTDDITNDETPTITVTLPAGTVVGELVELLVGATVVGSRIVTSADVTATTVQITTADLGADGAKAVTARITDLAGNPSGASATPLTITLDKTAVAPTTASITPSPTTPIAEGGTVTVTFDPTGITDVASVSVDFSAIGGGTAVAASPVGANWVATYNPAAGQDVSGAVKVRYTDTAGNPSTWTTDNATVIVDTKDPTAADGPMDLVAGNDKGVSDTDNITRDATVQVNALLAGTGAKVGDTIQLIVNGADVGAAVPLTSAVSHLFTGVSLNQSGTGTNNLIQFRITDAAGNIGPATGDLTIVSDSGAPPNVPTAAPTLKATSDSGFSNSDQITSATTPTIVVSLTGTNAVAGDVVRLYADGTATGTALTLTAAQVAGTAPVEMTTGTLANGVATITARLMDTAGNETAASPGVLITVDTVAPVATFTDAMVQTSPTSGTVTLWGTGFNTILSASETATTDVKARLDFTKVTLDTTTALAAADVTSATVTTAGTLTLTLAASGQAKLAAAALDGSVAVAVASGFLADGAGNLGTATFGSTPAEIDFQSTTVNFGSTPAGTLNVTNYAPSGTRIDIVGNSASEVTVGGSGNTTITAAGGGSVTLGGFTGSLDGSSVRFSDGTVLKRNTAGATSINGTNAVGGDQLIAGNSGDTLRGDAGDDLLIGGNGGDRLFGGSENDRLLGGLGNDFLAGGAGQDTFVFEAAFGADRIADFTAGASADSIDLPTGWTTALGTGGILTVRDGGGAVMGTIALLGQSFANQAAADTYLADITVI